MAQANNGAGVMARRYDRRGRVPHFRGLFGGVFVAVRPGWQPRLARAAAYSMARFLFPSNVPRDSHLRSRSST